MDRTITIGSLFSGIGGFELGLERGIPGSRTIWQVEQDPYCQKILKKHWKDSDLFDDVTKVGRFNLSPVDLICGGFPCQDISLAGKQKGINDGEKSSLWWEMWRIVGELRPRIVCVENVSAVTFSNGGGWDVLGSLAKIGYNAEWIDLRASDFGAPHRRERIFFVAYTDNSSKHAFSIDDKKERHKELTSASKFTRNASDTNSQRFKEQSRIDLTVAKACKFTNRGSKNGRIHNENYWARFPTQSPLCDRNDGISDQVARLRALGNAIVPQCSEFIGRRISMSGLL